LTRCSAWLNQADAVILSQSLRVHSRKLRSHRDSKDGLILVHAFTFLD
jgi:hypothetical protein